MNTSFFSTYSVNPHISIFGLKSNHLGNVLNVITDRKLPINSPQNKVDYYTADVVAYNDYMPFGALMEGRHGYEGKKHAFGFQGQLTDDEIKGEGNSINYTYRMHDPRLGRFFAVDPLAKKYPYYSPYQFSGNRLIDMIELEGLEPVEAPKGKAGVGSNADWTPSTTESLILNKNRNPVLYTLPDPHSCAFTTYYQFGKRKTEPPAQTTTTTQPTTVSETQGKFTPVGSPVKIPEAFGSWGAIFEPSGMTAIDEVRNYLNSPPTQTETQTPSKPVMTPLSSPVVETNGGLSQSQDVSITSTTITVTTTTTINTARIEHTSQYLNGASAQVRQRRDLIRSNTGVTAAFKQTGTGNSMIIQYGTMTTVKVETYNINVLNTVVKTWDFLRNK